MGPFLFLFLPRVGEGNGLLICCIPVIFAASFWSLFVLIFFGVCVAGVCLLFYFVSLLFPFCICFFFVFSIFLFLFYYYFIVFSFFAKLNFILSFSLVDIELVKSQLR